MKEKRLLSIVTPTYNRANLLRNAYNSLKKQTDMFFEWIIVDDGSQDNTENIVNEFIEKEDAFKIIYVKKENGGKHTALNESHKYISGEYVLILDSDDSLTEDAVESVHEEWDKYWEKTEIGVVIFLRGKTTEDPFCYVRDEYVPVDLLRYQRVCVYGNDCCEVIRTDLFKLYPFPIYKGEKFMSEGVLWHRVGLNNQCIYINKVIYICEYLEGGLTKSGKKLRISNPLGGMLNSELNMDKKNFFKMRVKNALLFVCYGFFAGISPVRILKYKKNYKLLKAGCLLPGFILYKHWKRKYL